MSLTLYGAPLSPFVRKVRLLLAEKGLDYQLEAIAPVRPAGLVPRDQSAGPHPGVTRRRPGPRRLQRDLPVPGRTLSRTAESPGRRPAGRAAVRWLEKYADYEIAPLATLTIFRNRILKPAMGQACEENDVRRALEEKLPAHFDYLENHLDGRAFFVGERLTSPTWRSPASWSTCVTPAKTWTSNAGRPSPRISRGCSNARRCKRCCRGTTDPRQARSESLNASLSSPSGAGISPPGLRSRPGPRR